ncbi:TonB-dependent receptor [Aurantiacibacter luteus]|nr:TonB-dependent receptor [Aurantiacibacter luteus]
MMLAAQSAYAQDTDQDDPAVEAQEDASPEAPEEADANPGETIYVSGIRASLESAQGIKRESDSIMDVIVAEDIGKLPDNTAAETIARIAGVQVNRFSDEASGILIRGLPDVATSYNGREIFTAELRRVQLQDFPAQALAGIEVYKSGTADIIEPGLAGLVNVRTRRPFDFTDQVIAGGIHGTYNDQSEKIDGDGNILFSDRWDVGDGEFGFLANFTYAQQQYYNGARYNSSFIQNSYWSDIETQGQNVRNQPDFPNGLFFFPNNIGLYNDGGKRIRPSANFAAQYAPSDDLQFYVEGVYQGYRGRGFADNFDVPLEPWGPNSTPAVFSNVVLLDGQSYDQIILDGYDPPYRDNPTVPQAASLTKMSGSDPQGYRNTTQDETNTYQVAAGAIWDATDTLTLSADVAYSWSRYQRDNYSLDFRTVGARTVNASFDSNGGVDFNFPDWDPFDPAGYIFRGYYEARYDVSGDGLQARADASWDTPWDNFPRLKFGVRATTRHSELTENGFRYADVSEARIPLADLPIGGLTPTINPFRNNVGFNSYLSVPRSGIYDNREALRQFTLQTSQDLLARFPGNGYYSSLIEDFSTENIQIPETSGWMGDENTYAAYLQTHWNFDVGAVRVDGIAGLRAVITDGSTFGISTVCLLNDGGTPNNPTDDSCDETLTPRTEYQNYTDWLPNISLRARFTDKLQLRLGYTQTRTKPDFGALNPALQIRPVIYQPCLESTDPNYDPTDTTSCRIPGRTYPDYTGSQGNPELQPFTSNNYDVSLEYYFSRTGFASVAAFYRDIYGFTTGVTRFRNDPVYGTLQLSSPINAADSWIEGFEVNFQTFLDDFLPDAFSGFGVSANVTYLKGETRLPNGYNPETDVFEGEGEYVRIPGLSEWTYNLALFYEANGITTRLSYNRRSDWVNGYNTDPDNGFQYTGNGTLARDRLDANFSYDITPNFTVFADVANILARPFRNFVGYTSQATFPIDVRDEGRYFGAGLRFRFGE